ncbi:MAG: hypothetical protein ACR2MD_13305 [Aridibacter sp.]
MNNKICKECGQTNLPSAATCTNCGSGLPQFESNPSDGQTKKKGSSKLYWILGGVGALILIGGFMVFALAAGIYLYSSSSDDVVEKKSISKSRVINKNGTTKKRGFSNKDIEGVFKAKKQVGKFKQVGIVPSTDDSKKIFKNASGESMGMYMGNSKKEAVMYVLASYTSKEKAEEDFRDFIDREKQKGAKMILDVTVDSANKSINANYKKGVITVISFCSWKVSNVTMCHSMGSPDPATALDFHNSWFGIK